MALNVNHRTNHKPIPQGLTATVLVHRPDVLVLTEYVEESPQHEFRASLADAGIAHILTSERVEYAPGQFTNQVLIASRHPLESISPPADPPDPHAAANVLLVKVGAITIAGLRAPWYPKETARQWSRYWDWITRGLHADAAIGDFNFDPTQPGPKHRVATTACSSAGWTFAQPLGEWSYRSHTGRTTRIDHLMTRNLGVDGVRYEHAGIAPDFTDHAALIATIRPPATPPAPPV